MAKTDYDSSIKVKQEVIDRIKKMGMSGALDAASGGGESAEFREGVKRMYGSNRLGVAQNKAMTESDKAGAESAKKQPTPMPKSAPAAASRKVGRGTSYGLSARNVEGVKKVTKPISNIANTLATQQVGRAQSAGKTLGGISKALGLNNPFKPRKR